jgi:DNA polymerase-3 subunit epsilon
MGRQVVLDTELTGLNVGKPNGDKLVSVGIVEIFNGQVTGKSAIWYINPLRKSTKKALEIHGLSETFLSTKPEFKKVAQEILDFIGDSEIIHHCWYRQSDDTSTDERALNFELKDNGFKTIPHSQWVNIKKWAQSLSKDKNSLDDMLDRYGIDRNARKKNHDALIDAEMTAKLYLKMAPAFKK